MRVNTYTKIIIVTWLLPVSGLLLSCYVNMLIGGVKLFLNLPPIDYILFKSGASKWYHTVPFNRGCIPPPLSSLSSRDGARLWSTLYEKTAYLTFLSLSKILQWWNDKAFLSNVFIAYVFYYNQCAKQYSMCETIIVYKNTFAALVSRNGLTCLKYCKLNLTICYPFYMSFEC